MMARVVVADDDDICKARTYVRAHRKGTAIVVYCNRTVGHRRRHEGEVILSTPDGPWTRKIRWR